MTTQNKTHLQQPVTSFAQLRDFLAAGARPREQWGVGAEMEKLVIDAETGEAASYQRIEALLEGLVGSRDWKPIREQGRLIGLQGQDSSVTLEPGGQLELSGALCPDLYCCRKDFCRYLDDILHAARPLGLLFLGLGVQPFTSLQNIDWLPKSRYAIMRTYMEQTGDMGQNMMKQSAGLQVNLDFADEADCIDKLQVTQLLAPLFYALFANSPLLEGQPSGFLSTRGEIWARTDPDRSGLIPGLFAEGADLGCYVDYALDVPMYFIVRQGQLIDMTRERFTFRRYWAEGFAGFRATLGDWDQHLSTLFPEVRLRPQIELRSADSLPPGLTLSVAALAKGLLYDDAARAEVHRLFRSYDSETFQQAYRQSWRFGLRTRLGGHTLRDLALQILTLAREGLTRQQRERGSRFDETLFLDGLDEIAESGVTLAERLLGRWHGSLQQRLDALKEHCGFEHCGP
ncbi:MAG: gamma-glutamylcysteine synthetase [Desulfuromonadales bacterium C00003096]|nr:MAG: gamma-glutamylcysteine synthetase [Desulfuromonadales bacterium C00003096]